MDRKSLMRLLATVAGAAAVVALLFVALLALNAEYGFAGCTGTIPLGWSLPLFAGLLIGGVAWMLLFQAPHYPRERGPQPRSVPCPECEKPVMADWRLCPYCGSVLPRVAPDTLRPADD